MPLPSTMNSILTPVCLSSVVQMLPLMVSIEKDSAGIAESSGEYFKVLAWWFSLVEYLSVYYFVPPVPFHSTFPNVYQFTPGEQLTKRCEVAHKSCSTHKTAHRRVTFLPM